MKKFWMVWNPLGRQPAVRHDTEQEAITEAERLASKHEGHPFFVLCAVSLSRVEPRNITTRLTD